MGTQTNEKYVNHLFVEMLNNLTTLQKDIEKLSIVELDLQASLAAVQKKSIKSASKAYWAIYTIAEHLKYSALSYPDAHKTWYQDLWFYYSLTLSESEMKACMRLITDEFKVAIQDDASFQLAVTFWQLLQQLNPNCCPNSEYYLEVLYQSPHNWLEHWGLTTTRIQHQVLQYYRGHNFECRQRLLGFVPVTHLFREVLIRPSTAVKNEGFVNAVQYPVGSKLYRSLIDKLNIKRNTLQYLRGLSLDPRYQDPEALQNALKAYPQTLLDVFSSGLIPIDSSNEFEAPSDMSFLFHLDTYNKAAFVFDGLCQKVTGDIRGYTYTKSLMKKSADFVYIARNNKKYESISKSTNRIKQQAYKDDVKTIIDSHLELIEAESKLLNVYGDIEAKYNNFQDNHFAIRKHIKSLTAILQEREQAIEYCRDWTQARARYIDEATEFGLKEELHMLTTLFNTIQDDFKLALKPGVSVSYEQKSGTSVGCQQSKFLSDPLLKFESIIATLYKDMEYVKRLSDELFQNNLAIEEAELTHQRIQQKFLMTNYEIHVQIPYLSFVALLAALVIVSVSIGILAGSPMCVFLVMPMLTEYTTAMAAFGISTGLVLGVPSGYNVMRYMLFTSTQKTTDKAEEEIGFGCFYN